MRTMNGIILCSYGDEENDGDVDDDDYDDG